MRSRLVPSFIVSAVVLACAAPAAARVEPGVHVDPNSPAAKEYAIPLQAARNDSGGGSRSRQTARFGAGIEPGSAHAARSDGNNRSPHKSKSHKLRLGDETRPGISKTAAAAGDSGSPALRLGGIALAVVVVAGLLGLGLRRGLRRGV
jgi:hypothetical protein